MREVWLRRAVSTLYYGVLHEVIAFLEEGGVRVNRNYRVHETVRTLLSNRIPKAGIWMGKLHKLRTFADYDIDKPFTYSDYKNALQLAKLVLREVGR
ncbi:MAG TPA: hypothetical protein ENJ61_00225 [Aquifex aeolicus]|uniref:HEPN domain-containing protein n=1 Tax=Aquifex aeolicus TaxID=63363 RepID=A0A7C5L4N5_AQUAO|nr:hypothetical protein [Aquifex aeolicus]